MTLIKVALRDKKKCYFCGSDKSVKYIFTKESPYLAEPAQLCVCNRCALIQIAGRKI